MAEKDITEKILMLYADVFADCENVLTYGGMTVLKPEELQRAPTESFYEKDGKAHDQFCDVSFYWVRCGKIIAQYIIENETQLRRRQVLRKISYEGGAYRAQLESGQPVYPVVSCVLEWTQKGTHIPLSLRQLLTGEGAMRQGPKTSGTRQRNLSADDAGQGRLPAGAAAQDPPAADIAAEGSRQGTLAADAARKTTLELVDDIRLTVHHMRSLPPETRRLFVSDMGFVADYLNEGTFENRRYQKIVHVKALCEMMEALTGDVRFTDLAEELLQRQRERKGVVMCEYIDMLEARGYARGEATGVIKGENRLAQLMQILLKEHRYTELNQIADNFTKRQELYQAYGI